MSAADNFPKLAAAARLYGERFPGSQAAEAKAALAEIDLLRSAAHNDAALIVELMQLVADLYDPNDCNTLREGDPINEPGLTVGHCFEHNDWEPSDNDGRGCPHHRARIVVTAAGGRAR